MYIIKTGSGGGAAWAFIGRSEMNNRNVLVGHEITAVFPRNSPSS
jgi:hypothetical protein